MMGSALFRVTGALLLAGICLSPPAAAEPIQVTDLAGRVVEIDQPIERFVLSEGRYVSVLALLRPENPVEGLVGMMSPLWWTQPDLERQLFEKFPEARDIPLFASKSEHSVSVEKIIDLKPQLAILGLSDHGPNARSAELIAQVEAAGVKIVFIDFRLDPLNNTIPSIELLGKLLGAEEQAARYIEFYRQRLAAIEARIPEITHRPTVFLQVHPGRRDCCWAMAEGMLGPFLTFVGGRNIADELAPGPTSQHTEEYLLTENPDVWIGTASGTVEEFQEGQNVVALGVGMTRETAQQSLARYLSAPAFQAMGAVQNGRAHVIWHNFYNSPFNIVAVEAFAAWVQPELFGELDPDETMRTIFREFLPFDLNGTYTASIPNE